MEFNLYLINELFNMHYQFMAKNAKCLTVDKLLRDQVK